MAHQGQLALSADYAECFENKKVNGVDCAIEVVGLIPAFKTALDIVATGGKISPIDMDPPGRRIFLSLTWEAGVHGGDTPFRAADCYKKNVSIQFGRCPVHAVFDEAVASLCDNREILEKMNFIDLILPSLDKSFSDALRRFNAAETNKVVFKPHGFQWLEHFARSIV